MQSYYVGFISVAIILAIGLPSGTATTDLKDVQARYGTITYGATADKYTGNVTLSNAGQTDIDSGSMPVTVYVCFIRLVIGSNSENGTEVNASPKVTVYHLDGCAHRIVYEAPFHLSPGESFSITLTQQFWSVTYTDVMQNWYIQLGDGEHQLIHNTNQDQTEFVDPFDSKEKYMRALTDRVLPLTTDDRYEDQEKKFDVGSDEARKRLVPGIFDSLNVDENTVYSSTYDPSSPLPITYQVDSQLGNDQFEITVAVDSSLTVALSSDSKPVRNLALSTLKQMLERFNNTLPVGTHRSKSPRYEYRGFMVDIARQFHSKEVIKRQLDLMQRYRLNYLHFHLIDDESWALEIEDIPELTTFGSKQCFDLTQCATYPQLGRQITSNRQFLSKQDYIEIVRYADSLGIIVVPEVELPGHSAAAVQAMKIRYDNSPDAVDYRLHDPLDTSEYLSVQYFTQGAMNPCVDSMFTFVRTVAENIARYHQEAGQPLKILHLAGDETASGAWTSSPACDPLTAHFGPNATSGEKTNFIKIEMMKKLGEIAEQLNVSLGFWEDGLINKTSGLPMDKEVVFPDSVDVYSYIWQTVWEWWGGDRAFNMANGGYKVVMAPATRYYMDHSQEPHPRERGYYWATRSTSLLRTFSFRPENYYANIDGIRRFGMPIFQESWCNPSKCPPLVRKENIVGVEAPLFGETIQTQDHIDNGVYPRLLAVAERAWNEGDWEKQDGENPDGLQQDFDSFRRSVELFEIPAIEDMYDVKYHLSPPGTKILREEGSMVTLQLSVEFEGQGVLWRMEGSDELTEATDLMIEYRKGTAIQLRTRNSEGNRESYEVSYFMPDDTRISSTVSSTTFLPASSTNSGDHTHKSFLVLALCIALFLS